MRRALLFLSLVFAGACTSADAPAADLQGTWMAKFSLPGRGLLFTLDQTDTIVAGGGTFFMEAQPSSGAIQVTGVYHRPLVRLSIHYDFGRTEVFTGSVQGASRMTGTLADTLSLPVSMAFERQ